jgi:hypothetical protein
MDFFSAHDACALQMKRKSELQQKNVSKATLAATAARVAKRAKTTSAACRMRLWTVDSGTVSTDNNHPHLATATAAAPLDSRVETPQIASSTQPGVSEVTPPGTPALWTKQRGNRRYVALVRGLRCALLLIAMLKSTH